jgi:hypothetical protein
VPSGSDGRPLASATLRRYEAFAFAGVGGAEHLKVGTDVAAVLPFLHGIGANGKGVLTLLLQGLLGDADAGGYAVSAPDGFLMGGRDGAHPTEIARLRGARLVVCSEQTSGKRFD